MRSQRLSSSCAAPQTRAPRHPVPPLPLEERPGVRAPQQATTPVPIPYPTYWFPGLIALSLAVIASGCPGSSVGTSEAGSTTGAPLTQSDLVRPSPEVSSLTGPHIAASEPAAAQQPATAATTSTDPASPSADWPNFRNGPDLRGLAGSTLPDNLQLLWELQTHDGVTSTAAIADGRVWVAELSGFIRCLDLRSGEEIWRYRTIENQDPEEFAPGFNAPVTLSDSGVFVGDEEGTLHALERDSGRPLWKPFDTDGEIKGGATILTPDPTTGAPRLLFGSHDGNLYCLNAATGEKLWQFDTRGPVNGSQAIHGNHTFVSGCDQPVLRVVDIDTGAQHAEVSLDGSLLIASPALVGDVLYFGTPDGEVIALDWVKKQRVWTYGDPSRKQEIHSSPAVTDQLVLIGSRDKRLHAIDRLTGQAVWTFETRGPIDSSPVVVGERIFFGSADRNVYAVDFTGKEVWKHNAGRRISASPAVGEGHLVLGCEGAEGRILCFGAMQ